MNKYFIIMISILSGLTLLLYIGGGIYSVIGTYIGAGIGIALIGLCYLISNILAFVCDRFN